MMSLYIEERPKRPCVHTMPLKRQVLKKEKTSSLSRRILDIYLIGPHFLLSIMIFI